MILTTKKILPPYGACARSSVGVGGGDLIHGRGQYSPVNNVWGDIIHGETLFTPTSSFLQTSVMKRLTQYASSLLLSLISSTEATSPMLSWSLFRLSAHYLHLETHQLVCCLIFSGIADVFRTSRSRGAPNLLAVATECDTELSGIFEARGDEHPVVCSASAAAWLKISSISASATTLGNCMASSANNSTYSSSLKK